MIPPLIFPATRGTIFTRKNIQDRTSPKGLPELNFLEFSKKWSSHLSLLRLNRVKRMKAERLERANKHAIRPFFPQSGVKVERADTNPDAKAKGQLYLTLSNGQVVRPDRLFAKGRNAHLIRTTFDYIEVQKEPAAQ